MPFVDVFMHRYDFDVYTEASDKMYGVFLRYAPVVMAVSCDEAFLELAEGTDPVKAATEVRFFSTGRSSNYRSSIYSQLSDLSDRLTVLERDG